jgi:hypothetical protein
MEPVANRDFLLAFIASNNNNFYNGINDININYYVYNNVINNYHYYMNNQNFQAGAAAVTASALETFERLGIDVCKVAPQEQAEEQDKSAEHSCEDAWSCSICQINEQEEEKEEEEEKKEEEEERKKNTKTINYTIYDLQSRLGHLHDLLTQPQKIHLRGFELLKLKSIAHTVQQRVDTLFFEANIPCNWKINVRWNTTTHSKTDVHITLLNYIVKERVKELLLDYFSHNYNNIIYID